MQSRSGFAKYDDGYDPVSREITALETISRYYRIERNEIAFLKFIIEAYEGLATLTTINAHEGLVVLRIAPDCEGEVAQILAALQEQMRIEPQPTLHAN